MHITGRTHGRVDHEQWGHSPPGTGPHGPRAFSARPAFARLRTLPGKPPARLGPPRLPPRRALTRRAAALSLEARYAEMLRRDLFHVQHGVYRAQLLVEMPMQSYAHSVPSALRAMPAWLLEPSQEAQLQPGEPARPGAMVHAGRALQSPLGLRARARALRVKGLALATAGSVDMMRRQVIPPSVAYLQTCATSVPRVLEVHIDGPRTSLMVQASFPEAEYEALGLDSPCIEARRVPQAQSILPQEDGRLDLILCSFVLHRLPCSMVHQLLVEFERVLSPGGRLVLLDVLQSKDLEGLGGAQPPMPSTHAAAALRQYLSHDLQATLTDQGWQVLECAPAFLAKVIVAERPGATPAQPQS